MRSRLAFLPAVAGLVLCLANHSSAQPPPGGGGNPGPALEHRVLTGLCMYPNMAEVSPYNNVWAANEVSGILRCSAVYEWFDAEWNPLDEFEIVEITYVAAWTMAPNYYQVIKDENLFQNALIVNQDYCTPGISDKEILVTATYDGMSVYGTIWILN